MFDGYLRALAERTGTGFVPFDAVADYDIYVDGKPRADGIESFLVSRGIELPAGCRDDQGDAETVYGLGQRKNELVLRKIREDGVQAYAGSVRYVRAVRDAGLSRAVVSASTNCGDVLAAAGIDALFDVRVDGLVAEHEKLRGKPAPDTFLAAAAALGVVPGDAAVFEDALAGVAAGRAGGFYVVGVDRAGQAGELRANGADIVVGDLTELLDQP